MFIEGDSDQVVGGELSLYYIHINTLSNIFCNSSRLPDALLGKYVVAHKDELRAVAEIVFRYHLVFYSF